MQKLTVKQARRIARKLNVRLEISSRETDEYLIGGALNLAVLTHVRTSRVTISETQYEGRASDD